LISVLKAVLFATAVTCSDIVAIIKNYTEHWIPGLPASERNITNSAPKKLYFCAEIVLRLAEFSLLEKYLKS
jgi:hypothetical protein